MGGCVGAHPADLGFHMGAREQHELPLQNWERGACPPQLLTSVVGPMPRPRNHWTNGACKRRLVVDSLWDYNMFPMLYLHFVFFYKMLLQSSRKVDVINKHRLHSFVPNVVFKTLESYMYIYIYTSCLCTSVAPALLAEVSPHLRNLSLYNSKATLVWETCCPPASPRPPAIFEQKKSSACRSLKK